MSFFLYLLVVGKDGRGSAAAAVRVFLEELLPSPIAGNHCCAKEQHRCGAECVLWG